VVGAAAVGPYSELRVSLHWLNIFDYGLGISPFWGIHDVDIAQWVNQSQYTTRSASKRPASCTPISGYAHSYDIEYKYANGVRVNMADLFTAKKRYPQFVRAAWPACSSGPGMGVREPRGMRRFPNRWFNPPSGPTKPRDLQHITTQFH